MSLPRASQLTIVERNMEYVEARVLENRMEGHVMIATLYKTNKEKLQSLGYKVVADRKYLRRYHIYWPTVSKDVK